MRKSTPSRPRIAAAALVACGLLLEPASSAAQSPRSGHQPEEAESNAPVPGDRAAQPAESDGGAESARLVEARKLFEAGRALAAERRWAEAEEKFLASSQLVRRANTLFNLGVVRQRQAKHLAAHEAFAETISGADPVRDAALISEAKERLSQCEYYLQRVELTVAPQNAEVRLDGAAIQATGGKAETFLEPGRHELVARAPGYAERSYAINAEAGGSQRLAVTLVPIQTSATETNEPSAAARPVPSPRSTTSLGTSDTRRTRWGAPQFVTLGGGAVLLGAAITGGAALAADRKVINRCPPSEPCSDPSLEGTRDRAMTLGHVADALWIVGGAAVVVGGSWWLLDQRRARVSLTVAPTQAGFTSEVRCVF